MTHALHATDAVGAVGVAVLVVSYLLLQNGRLSGESVPYYALNAAGSGLVLFSLFFDFNVSAFVVEAFWLAISLRGMWTRRTG